MSLIAPNWRSFQNIFSDAEAASFSEFCLFSLSTLEVACDPASTNFALTERERPGAWQWAVINDRNVVLQAGCEPTQVAAKRAAARAL